jgi:hypothetical protein
MPTLLVRATVPLGGGLVVTETDRDALRRAVPHLRMLELDRNHFGVLTDERTAAAVAELLAVGSTPDAEQIVSVGHESIEIAYQRFGDPRAPAVSLIQGLSLQMLSWHEQFCAELATRGLQVIRFDNRDVGRSTHLTDAPTPDFPAAMAGDLSSASYTLSDMAADQAVAARRVAGSPGFPSTRPGYVTARPGHTTAPRRTDPGSSASRSRRSPPATELPCCGPSRYRRWSSTAPTTR